MTNDTLHREIVFRGMTLRSNKWVYGDLINNLEGCFIGQYMTVQVFDEYIHDEYKEVQVIPESVGQYAGIKTKIGVRLFENDIICSLDSTGKKVKHLVSWSNNDASFVAQFIPYFNLNPHCSLRQEWVTEFDKKTIGNTTQNPELLK